MKKLIGLDFTTLATIQETGDVCCQTCGSWTQFEDMVRDGQCPLCRMQREQGETPFGAAPFHTTESDDSISL